MKIVLLRHGKSGLLPWSWIYAQDLGNWICAYNSAGIRDAFPPPAAVNAARACNVLVTSDLLRSVESGRALGCGAPLLSNGQFREAELPFTSRALLKMPPAVWAITFRFLWSFGFSTNGETILAFQKRAKNAALELISLARSHGSVLLVGHGLINRYIARELLAAGWRGPRRTKIRYWGFTEYIYADRQQV